MLIKCRLPDRRSQALLWSNCSRWSSSSAATVTDKLIFSTHKHLRSRDKPLQPNFACSRPTGANLPVAFKYLYQGVGQVQCEPQSQGPTINGPIHLPFASFTPLVETDPEGGLKPGRRLRRTRRGLDLSPNVVDTKWDKLDFDVYGADADRQSVQKSLREDDMLRFGSADPSMEPSQVACSGCGSHLHCQDPMIPGFLPAEVFRGKSARQLRSHHCQRCFIMKKYQVALKVSVSPDDYPKAISHIREIKAIVLLIVDLTDFPGSVWPNILELLGNDKRIILVGNKVDLLPSDGKDYLVRVKDAMTKCFLSKCRESGIRPWIFSSMLVSARTGFNIEALISKVYRYWRDYTYQVGGNVYLVGTTNVGKSSLFNVLIGSDMCKVQALNLVDKAMTSPVPGTTLNLLKFPIMRPDPSRLAQRHERLQREQKELHAKEQDRLEMLRHFKDRRLAAPSGHVGNSFLASTHQNIQFVHSDFSVNASKVPKARKLPPRLDPKDPAFSDGKWCYDTPGSISHDQIINILTQKEVLKTLPKLPIAPRSFSLRVGETLFIAGLARLDILSGPESSPDLIVTVYAADTLPVNIVRSSDADQFYNEACHIADLLVVPEADRSRLQQFPPLEGVEFQVDGLGPNRCTCDIVFSSAGWVSTSSKHAADLYRVKAWTPGGRGIHLRDPPLLAEMPGLIGRRIRKSRQFEHRLFIPAE